MKNMFEVLSENINFYDEVKRIGELLDENDIEDTVDENITMWKYRERRNSLAQIRKALRINFEGLVIEDDLYQKEVVLYLEYVTNVIELHKRFSPENHSYSTKSLKENIRFLFDYLNLRAVNLDKNDIKYIVIEDKPEISAAAELVEDDERSLDIIRYNHHALKGNLDEKRKILSQLYKEFENIRNDIEDKVRINKNHKLDNELGMLFNSTDIRHGRPQNKIVHDNFMALPDKEKEAWYDRIYDMFLAAILAKNYVDMKDDLDMIKSDGQVE